MSSTVQQELRRYAKLIESALPADIRFEAAGESPSAVRVERGTIYPLSLAGRVDETAFDRVDRLVRLAAPQDVSAAGASTLSSVAVVDRSGHRRPAYRPLLVYAWLQSFRLLYEMLPRMEFGRWDEALRAWCDALEAGLANTRVPADVIPAADGAAMVESAWAALALWAAGRVFVRDAWTDLASDTFGRLIRPQRDSGAFFLAGPGDGPEPVAYHELSLLHAAASYAVQAEDRTVAAAVARATAHHQNETQPDHATAQPWGLFAFIWDPATRPFADQVLHAVSVQHPNGAGGVTLILLADALYCLRLFDGPGT